MEPSLLKRVKNHALEVAPNEACGFLVVDNIGGVHFRPCKNLAHDPKNKFQIDDKETLSAIKSGYPIVFHSHAGNTQEYSQPKFSIEDKEMSEETCMPFLLYSQSHDDFIFYQPKSALLRKLIGRPFVWGFWDCYTLVRDYFHMRFGAVLNYYFVPQDLSMTNQPHFEEHFEVEGFKEVPVDQMQEHDALMFRIRSDTTNHVGVYIGKNKFMHQGAGNISCQEEIDRYFKYLYKVVRFHG